MQVTLQPGERLEIVFAVGPVELPRGVFVQFEGNEEEAVVLCDGIGATGSGDTPAIIVRDVDQG